jgi:hypothetical protein
MDGLTVLVEAKKEYLAQLCCVMCPHMITVFETMYTESTRMSNGKQVLIQFQKLLKEVPNWNDHMISQHVSSISSSCGWFNDLVAAVFVSYVKILSSVRINSDNKKISLKLPSNDVFIHGCFIHAAKDLYKDPYVYHEEMSEYDRDANLTRRFIVCIENTVKQMIPIQEILKTYISHKDDIDMSTQVEEPDEQFAEEPVPEPEPEPEPAPVPEVPGLAEAPAVPETSPPPPENEVKNINVNGQVSQQEEDVLFPDAQ